MLHAGTFQFRSQRESKDWPEAAYLSAFLEKEEVFLSFLIIFSSHL